MAISPFQWGPGNQVMTPGQAKEARSVAAALAGSRARPAANGWEGLVQVANALSERGWRDEAAKAEAAGQSSVAQALAGLGPNSTFEDLSGVLANPWVTESPGASTIASALLQRNLDASDPMRQLDMAYKQAQLDSLQNPQPENPYLNVGGGSIFNTQSGEFMQAPGVGDESLPADVQEYNWYAEGEAAAGRQPLSYLDFVNAQKGNGLSVTTNPDGTTTVTQGGPGRPLTEQQSKDTVYATRAEGALPTIDALGDELMNPVARAVEGDPTGIARGAFQSEDFQKAQQAGKEFLQALLRKDTGAAITPQETSEYGSVYLPVPGDTPGVLAQKKQARRRGLAALKSGMPPQAILAQEKALMDSGSLPAASQDEGWQDLGGGIRIRPMGQ